VSLLAEVMMPLMSQLRGAVMEGDEAVLAAKGLMAVLGGRNETAAFVKGANPNWSAPVLLRKFEQTVNEVKRLESFFKQRVLGNIGQDIEDATVDIVREQTKRYQAKGMRQGMGFGVEPVEGKEVGRRVALRPEQDVAGLESLAEPFPKLSQPMPTAPGMYRQAMGKDLYNWESKILMKAGDQTWDSTVRSVRTALTAAWKNYLIATGRSPEEVLEMKKWRQVEGIIAEDVRRSGIGEELLNVDDPARSAWQNLANAEHEYLLWQEAEMVAKRALLAAEVAATATEEDVLAAAFKSADITKSMRQRERLRVRQRGGVDPVSGETLFGRQPNLMEEALTKAEAAGPIKGRSLTEPPPVTALSPDEVTAYMLVMQDRIQHELMEISYLRGISEEAGEIMGKDNVKFVQEALRDNLEGAPSVIQQLTAAEFYKRGKTGMWLDSFGSMGKKPVAFSEITVDQLEMAMRQGVGHWGTHLIAFGDAPDPKWYGTVIDAMLAAQKITDREQVRGFLHNYDRFHNWIKAQMVATPGFVSRNLLGGMVNMWFKDIPVKELFDAGKKMQQAYRAGNGDLRHGVRLMVGKNPESASWQRMLDLVDVGAHAGGQAATAIEAGIVGRSRFYFIWGQKGERAGRRAVYAPWSTEFAPWAAIRHANTFAEEVMRLATGAHAMKVGGSIDDALYLIHMLHFDYGELSRAEREGFRRFFPFYTWTRNNLPLQLEMAVRHPKKWNRMFQLKRNLERTTEEEGTVPDYFMNPFGVRLPFQMFGAQTYSVPDTPFQEFLRYDPWGMRGVGGPIETVFSQLTPIAKNPVEYWAGKQVFAGIPFTERYQQVPFMFRTIPGLLQALEKIGWAKKNKKGEWKMMDNRIHAVGNLMPFLGVLQRILPGLPKQEKRRQQRYITALVSTLAGINFKINSTFEQRNERIRQEIELNLQRRDWRDIELRER